MYTLADRILLFAVWKAQSAQLFLNESFLQSFINSSTYKLFHMHLLSSNSGPSQKQFVLIGLRQRIIPFLPWMFWWKAVSGRSWGVCSNDLWPHPSPHLLQQAQRVQGHRWGRILDFLGPAQLAQFIYKERNCQASLYTSTWISNLFLFKKWESPDICLKS